MVKSREKSYRQGLAKGIGFAVIKRRKNHCQNRQNCRCGVKCGMQLFGFVIFVHNFFSSFIILENTF